MSSWLVRLRPGLLVVFGTSTLGGAAYRYKASSTPDASLNPHTFTPYTLLDKQRVSSTSAIFTLRNTGAAAEPESVSEAWERGGVWSVQVKQPQLQIARAYTPLPPRSNGESVAEEQREGEVRLLIRAEEGGEVSNYLHRLPEQATIELRGPNVECELPRDVEDVVFLAGGTGIAPAMQVARSMARKGGRMEIFWANRMREECVGGVGDAGLSAAASRRQLGWWKSLFGSQKPESQESPVHDGSRTEKGLIVQELEALKHSSIKDNTESLTVQYYVDEEHTLVRPDDVAKRLQSPRSTNGGSKLILVSGPNGFIEHWAGKKVWAGGREAQGPLGGVLGKMDLKDWKVFKL